MYKRQGQRVVLHPSDKVEDGSLVEVRNGTAAEWPAALRLSLIHISEPTRPY